MATSYALDQLGYERVSSPTVWRELDLWLKVCAMSAAQLDGPSNDWPTLIGPAARDVLEAAMNALGRRKAAPLRAVVHRADEQFIAKTLPNPHSDPTAPWWWRRAPE